MHHWTVQYNTLTAAEFIRLWESVWDGAPTREQVQLALAHTLFRVAVYDGEQVIGMARMLGDLGMNYYIKDVVVLPAYQRQGVGRLLLEELMKYIRENGVPGTDIFVELCAVPDKIPFYERFGFTYGNTAQRMCGRCANRFFVRLHRNDAGILAYCKEFLCDMTENSSADAAHSRQAGFVRCCLIMKQSGSCVCAMWTDRTEKHRPEPEPMLCAVFSYVSRPVHRAAAVLQISRKRT